MNRTLHTLFAAALAVVFAASVANANAYLTFSSTNAFSITPKVNSWDGTLEYSTDAMTWEAFTTNGAAAATNAAGDYNLYLRGTSNTVMTGDAYTSGWKIAATGTVACIGNIETLLDYETVAAGQHPAMANGCFANLFYSWTNLTAAPTLPATNLAEYCYLSMFYRCTGLTNAPALPASTLAANCYEGMFFGCTGLTNAPALPATNLAASCYLSMFNACTGLTEAPDLPAMNMLESCYSSMFSSCKGLANAPALPATNLADSCYTYMFYKCPGLTNAPALPAMDLTNDCYRAMFHGCSGLTTPPELPATNLAKSCYQNMFAACTGLTNAPALPAAKLLYSCYFSMFRECTGLTEAPELPATTLAVQCYAEMFAACTGLTNAPALPAANLAANCYFYMFRGCTGLTRLPELSAINLAPYCYEGMFYRCTGITLSEDGTGPTWSIPEDATPAAGWNTNMLVETGGPFTNNPVIGATYYYTAPPPSFSNAHLTFTSDEAFSITPQVQSWQGTLEYSTDAANWAAFTTGGAEAATNASGKYLLYLRGTSNTCMTGYARPGWLLNATGPVACSGNIETLLDYTTVAAGQHPAMADFCFAGLFMDWTNLTEAPDLPATNLTPSCYRATFSGCGNLTTAPELPATTLASHCYYFMFFACPGLTNAPALPATDLADNCYENMFRSCTGLTKAPDLPATNLAVWCYGNMFNGCRALTQAPALPAATLPNSCYVGMFQDCRALTNAPALPATNLLFQCYANMFRGCTSLTEAPDLPAMNLAGSCYKSMFHGCTGLTRVPELPATNLLRSCYEAMFKNCTGITLHETGTAPTWGIPAGATEIMGWNESMLAGTGGTFTNNPVIGKTYYYNAPPPPVARSYLTFSSTNAFTIAPQTNSWDGTLECSTDGTNWVLFTTNGAAAATNAAGEYKLYICGTSNTFITGAYGTPGWKITAPTGTVACAGNIETLLDYATVNASNHPAMANYGFTRLFYDCAALSSAPELPATNLTEGCYNLMFYNCTGLLEAPELPAVTMAEACYGSMFRGCAALTNAPNLPATNLADGCYYTMFSDCTSLTETPALPATTMMFACYSAMFGGCANLTETPALSAMTLANGCYDSMFRNCTSLTRLPALPATNLTDDCYRYMFSGCSGIELNAVGPGTPWGIPAGAQPATDWNQFMLDGTGGAFTDDPVIGAIYYYNASPPPAPRAHLTFSSTNAFTIKPQTNAWDGTLECSTDMTNWVPFTTAGAAAATNAAGEYNLYICGTSNTRIVGNKDADGWKITAPTGTVACSGNIESLLDYTKVLANEHPVMADYCFANLFRYCPALSSAPELPATTLTTGCYYYLFGGCTGLTEAPALPATNLADRCYRYMFTSCSGLAQAPALPATTLAPNCYQFMFQGCSSLTNAPALPATTLASYCYNFMFASCSSLTQAPDLPATNLANYCYQYMFNNCSGLTNAPALPAMTLANYGYAGMFQGCTSLTRLPELPATQLANYCYQSMFQNCTGITLYEAGTAPTWGIPAAAQAATNWNANMLVGTGGTFTNNPVIGTIYYYTPPPPVSDAYLTFSSTNAFKITPLFQAWEGTLECSTDATTWTNFTTAGAAAASNGAGEYKLYLRGTNNTCITGGKFGWKLDATGAVACSGNIETLLDYVLVDNGGHPAMADNCFADMFKNWKTLIRAPELPATNLAKYGYQSMFEGCTALTNAPALPATTLANNCYDAMFQGCTALAQTPALPATNLATYCYQSMFKDCTALTNATPLTAGTLTNYCYHSMFAGCTSLTQAPELPATNLAKYCYYKMFSGCTGLTNAPALPATTLVNDCYNAMFTACTSLANTPALTAGTLADRCYKDMFSGCTGLTNAPALPATTLANYCYWGMFRGCTSLMRLPALQATNLFSFCYDSMFKNCTGITLHAVGTAPTWSIPADVVEVMGWNTDMLAGTGGTFTGDPAPGVTYYYAPPPAPAAGAYITFSSTNTFSVTPQSNSWNGILLASTDATNWVTFTTNGATAATNATGEYRLYLSGWGNNRISDYSTTPAWKIDAADQVACSGNIESLLDHPKVAAGEEPDMANYCFANLFKDCTALIRAPELPAMTLGGHAYHGMFTGCTGLTNAPALPATNLTASCYEAMFAGCTGLTDTPALPAQTLADSCYRSMFENCTSLTNAPELSATVLEWDCYNSMFLGCTGLTRLPALPATNLTPNCYRSMFENCTGITLYEAGAAPTWGIPAGATSAQNWNANMLAGTGGTFTGNPVIGALYYYSLAPVAVEVVYDATGGAFAGGTSIVTQFCAAVYGQLPIANRNGYTLLGWFNGFAPGAAQAVSGGPLITNAPHRLHAHWTAAPGGTAASLFKYTINADGTITITGFKNPDQKAQKVVLPDRIDGRFVTGIAMGAFENSTSGMTEVYFPVFCTNIADKAFISVPSIKRLSFPPNRDWRNPTEPADLHIGKYAFSGATGLTELTLPKTVVALGDFAFLNTRNLRNVTVLGEPIVGLQVFRSAGVDVGGVIVHLAPAMAADPDYMATFKQGMYNVTVRTDAVIAGIWMGKMRLAAPGGVAPIILNISVEKAAEWGEVNLSALRVEYRAKLDAASQVLLPSSAVREADGSITLELNVPDGDESGFFRVFAL